MAKELLQFPSTVMTEFGFTVAPTRRVSFYVVLVLCSLHVLGIFCTPQVFHSALAHIKQTLLSTFAQVQLKNYGSFGYVSKKRIPKQALVRVASLIAKVRRLRRCKPSFRPGFPGLAQVPHRSSAEPRAHCWRRGWLHATRPSQGQVFGFFPSLHQKNKK